MGVSSYNALEVRVERLIGDLSLRDVQNVDWEYYIPNSRVDIAQGGSITGLSAAMRQMQLGLKFLF